MVWAAAAGGRGRRAARAASGCGAGRAAVRLAALLPMLLPGGPVVCMRCVVCRLSLASGWQGVDVCQLSWSMFAPAIDRRTRPSSPALAPPRCIVLAGQTRRCDTRASGGWWSRQATPTGCMCGCQRLPRAQMISGRRSTVTLSPTLLNSFKVDGARHLVGSESQVLMEVERSVGGIRLVRG